MVDLYSLRYCEYILDRLSRFPRSAAEERQEAACILAYIHYLRKISALGYQDMKTKQGEDSRTLAQIYSGVIFI